MTEPLTLMDLRRKKALHQLNGAADAPTIEIMGLTAADYCSILDRFQNVGFLSLGGKINIFEVMREVPAALAAWVAAACGMGGNAEAEKHVLEELTVDEAMGIAEASMPLTFVHGGFGPFFARQTAVLAQLFPVASHGKDEATTSPPPSPPSEEPQMPSFGS